MTFKSSFFLASLAATLLFSGQIHAAVTLTPIGSYDPYAPIPSEFRAGLDFDDSGHGAGAFFTQPGFLGVPNSNNKSYNLTHNGINFDIQVSNANLPNQNRWRGFNARGTNAGILMNDFEQWYGNLPDSPEATFSLSGLDPDTKYFLDFYQFNVGAGQTTHSFYDGASSSDPLIGTYGTTGNQNNYATWSPGSRIQKWSDANGDLTLTVQADGQRITLAGLAVSIPEPSSFALLGLGGFGLLLRRRR